MQVVIFGADKLGIDFYFEIKANEEVVAFIDNNVEKQGTAILGINVYSADISVSYTHLTLPTTPYV